MEIKEKDELQKAWLKSAKEDFQIAKDLVGMKHYQWALFFMNFCRF